MDHTIGVTLVLLSLSLAASGCAVDSAPRAGDDSDEHSASTGQALAGNGSGGASSGHCHDGWCTCTGDADCNDMYSGGECGSDPGVCQINDADVPRCRCKAAVRVKPPVRRLLGVATAKAEFLSP